MWCDVVTSQCMQQSAFVLREDTEMNEIAYLLRVNMLAGSMFKNKNTIDINIQGVDTFWADDVFLVHC